MGELKYSFAILHVAPTWRWSDSRSGRFILEENPPYAFDSAGLDTVEKGIISYLYQESNPGRPASSFTD
jgi:hypothetical protein